MQKNKRTLTEAFIEKAPAPVDKRFLIIWDADQPGLGLKIEKTGHKSFIYQYRFKGLPKRGTIGACNKYPLKDVRKKVTKYANDLLHNIDPFGKIEEKTLAEVCEEYLGYRKAGEGREKKVSPKTAKNWHQIIDCYIKEESIGKISIREFGVPDANRFFDALSHIPVQANRIRGFLNLVFKYAVGKGYRDIYSNVWEYVHKYEEEPSRPRLSDDEFKKFVNYLVDAENGKVLDKQGAKINHYWIKFVWLLYFTGARPNEILTLQWKDVDLENKCIALAETKTGAKHIHLSVPAIEVLKSVNRVKDNPYVIAGRFGENLKTYSKQWNNMREQTGIKAPPYGLRRYFAQIGKEISEDGDIKVLARIMGHATVAMTEMYAGESEEAKKQERKVVSLANERLGKALQDRLYRLNTESHNLNTLIRDTALSIAAKRVLEDAGLKTIGDIIKYTELQLIIMPNMGRKTIEEIKVMLSNSNLSLFKKNG